MAKKRKTNTSFKPSSKPDVKAENHIIEILINNFDQILDDAYVKLFLLDFFDKERSPVKPVYVKPELFIERNAVQVKATVMGLQIGEIIDDPEKHFGPLANIQIQNYPNHVAVFIASLRSDAKSSEKIRIITKEIVKKMQELKFEIGSVKPAELQPEAPLTDLKEIEGNSPRAKRPNPPPIRSGLAGWFKYYENCKKAGFRITLKEIANESGYSHGYIRSEHSSFRREQDYTTPDKEPDKI